MGTNRVRNFREKAGLTIKELAQKANLHTNCIMQVERAAEVWGHTPWHGADKAIASALNVKLSDIFSDYQLPKKHRPAELPPDTRTPEEIEEDLRLANEALRNPTKIADEYLICQFEETSPGIFQGQGNFVTWQQLQKRRNQN